MPSSRRTLTLTFVLVTIFFTSFTIYTGYIYFQVFYALRVFNVKIASFSFYGGQLVLVTDVSLKNPSSIPFGVLYIIERIEKIESYEYIYIGTTIVDKKEEPLDIPPQGNQTIATVFKIPDYMIEEVTSGLENTWQLSFVITVKTLVVGDFLAQYSFETQMESL